MEKTQLASSVIIIGAGPAGAGTSFFLTKYGIPHVIIDKATFPRDKVCGDACSGKTALVINRAHAAWMDEIMSHSADFLPSWGIRFVAPNGRPLDIPFTDKKKAQTRAPGFTTPRLVLDEFLFRKMKSEHCTVFEGAVITSIHKYKDGVTVNFEKDGRQYVVSAPVIVGADGDKGVVRKTLLPAFAEPKAMAVGLRGYYQGVTGFNDQQFIELHFLKEMLPGYLWIFPLPGAMANVGVGISSEVIRRKKLNLRQLMMDAIANNPALAPRFAQATLVDKIQGWGLPLAADRMPVSGDGFMLTGDAACLVDPFSGEGIGNALYSGMLAAAAIQGARAANDYSGAFLKTAYDDVLYKRLGDEFRVSATLQRLAQYPWLFNFVVNKALKSASLRDTISCMFTDMDLRGQFTKPSFYIKILMNR